MSEMIEIVAEALRPYLDDSVHPKEAARTTIATYEAWLIDNGLVIVPREPTEAMLIATFDPDSPPGQAWRSTPSKAWRAMIDEALKPPTNS